ncbi:MAG TPA: sigma-70 family RNA polymerase sigma factor [Trebonia sp.]|nr:sigma-70 family RNA polymerase sigma factor [Trebonia sp.]
MHARDSEIVASIVAGDPSGLAAAYDRYAEPLYKYCRSMLSNPADAADAVQDTFVIAACRLAELRDPGRLRAWLYAVARNECLLILRSPRPAPRITVPPGMTDTVIDITEGAAERAELRALLTTAARGLNGAEREVLELQLRQGLETAEVADVLGVSRSQAAAPASRARDQLEASLAVLLVGRAGRDDCRALNALLADWNGQLTPALRGRAARHIKRCATCTTRRVYELRPAVLLGLSAGAAVAAAAAKSLRLAAGVPDDLKARTMALAAGQDPGAVTHRTVAGDRAGPFGRHGFPGPLPNPGAKAAPLSSPRRRTVLAAAAVLVVAVGAVAFALSSGPSAHLALADGKTAPAVRHASSADPAMSSGGLEPSTTAPTAHQRSSATATASSKAPSAAPTTTTPAAPVTTTPPPVTATLSVSLLGSAVSLQPGAQITVGRFGARLSLKANSGPVSWSITASGGILVWPRSSGTLAAGSSTSVVIASAGRNVPGATLTINPGGASYPLVVNSRF